MLGTKSKKKATTVERELTKPARAIESLTDPRLAKRTMTVVKIAAPILAPYLLLASTNARAFLDQQRANRLGVPVSQVGVYRGPTGPTGARITGLRTSVEELNARKGSSSAVAGFVSASRGRLADLTIAVQAAASMPGGERRSVLKAVNRELDQISADLMTHLIGVPLS